MNPRERELWLARRNRLPNYAFGSSEAPAVCGQDPYKTTYELAKSKIERTPIGDNPENEPARQWGLVVEPALAQYYGIRTNTRPRKVKRIIQHPKHDFMYASLDYEVGGINIECKSTQIWLGLNWGNTEWSDEVPFPVIIQAHHQMSCSGKKETHVPATVGGGVPRFYKIILDVKIEAMIIELEHDLSQMIRKEQLPNFDWSHARTPELIKELYGVDDMTPPKVLDETAMRLVNEYEELGKFTSQTKAQRAIVQAKLRAMMETSSLGLLPDGRTIRRKLIHVNEHPVKEHDKEDFRILKKGSKATGLIMFEN